MSFSDVYFLGDLKRIIYLNSKVSNCALDLGMPQKQLDRPRSRTRSHPRSLLSIAKLKRREISVPTQHVQPRSDRPDVLW
jgi:hypothetical protein